MRRIDALVFCCVAACLFAVVSCSSVFTSTITGTVQELDGTQTKDVSDVDVYAFLTESERNEAVSNGAKPETTVRIFHAITDANGSYSIPVEWNSSHPTFGKTADRISIYLAFYHKDFNNGKLSAAKTASFLSSERTNTMETETLSRSSDSYTLNLTRIMDVSGNNSNIAANNFTVKVTDSTGATTYYEGTPTTNSVTFSGSTSGVSGKVYYTPNNAYAYVQCDADGNLSTDAVLFALTNKNSTVPAADCYMKHLVVAERTIDGYYTLGGEATAKQDGLTVTLYAGTSAVAANKMMETTTAVYYPSSNQTVHGHFTLTIPEKIISASQYTPDLKLYSVSYFVEVADADATNTPIGKTVTVTSNPRESTTLSMTLKGTK